MPGETPDEMRERYLADAIETASPAVRLTMLCDRLVLDMARADLAFEHANLKEINDNLVHAQQILLALRDTLRMDVWDGAARVAALYDYLHTELVGANVHKDRARAQEAGKLIAQLCDAWHAAAARTAGDPPAGHTPISVQA